MEIKYQIRSSESGDVIEDCVNLEEAEKTIQEYIDQDMQEGTFTKGFYEIYDCESQEVIETK